MNHLRTFVGSAGFIVYLSLLIGTIKFSGPGFLFSYLWWGHKDLLEPLGSLHDILVFIILVELSMVFLSLGYFFLNSIQKKYVAICGETYICFFASYFLSYLFFRFNLVSMRIASFKLIILIYFLIILVYHFVINRRTLKELGFIKITHIPFIIAMTCILFIVFAGFVILAFHQQITFHLPSFNDCIYFFIIHEEIMFRYYIQREGVEAFGVYPSIFIASFLFSVIHFVPGIFVVKSFVYRLLVGCIIGWAYHRCRNLSVPIVLHGVTNLFVRIFIWFQMELP
ncbi:MAG: CPBP family intramembrane metalloprotease [Candidatus Methanofastidiosia archaeon]|jgi:membrane protease YdiL (CAAX protease family)